MQATSLPSESFIKAPSTAAIAVADGLVSLGWEADLEVEAQALLATGRSDVWDVLTRRFESKLTVTLPRRLRSVQTSKRPSFRKSGLEQCAAQQFELRSCWVSVPNERAN